MNYAKIVAVCNFRVRGNCDRSSSIFVEYLYGKRTEKEGKKREKEISIWRIRRDYALPQDEISWWT